MAIPRSRVVLVGLGLVLAASLWRTVAVEREKRRIADAYKQAHQLAQQLGEERAHLNDELSQAKQTIEGQTSDISHFQNELQGLQTRLDTTMTELAALQREHEELRQSNASLATQLSSVSTEKQQLEQKLSSLKELKLAIRDVRRKMWDERLASWRAHIQAVKAADEERLATGNRGYLVHNGTPTLGSHTKMQVHVLEPQSQ